MSKITVLVVPVGRGPYIAHIENKLDPQRALVGGHLEAVVLEQGIVLICNEDGMALNLPYNRPVQLKYNGIIHILGDFYITRADEEGESVSLTAADISKYSTLFGG